MGRGGEALVLRLAEERPRPRRPPRPTLSSASAAADANPSQSLSGALNKGRTPARLAAHQAAIRANLSEPGRLRSFRDLTLQLDHRVVEPRVAQVEAPVLAVYGALDPDYADPATEAAWAEQALGATTLLLPDVGHYPQLQAPEEVVAATLDFLSGLPDADARPDAERSEDARG